MTLTYSLWLQHQLALSCEEFKQISFIWCWSVFYLGIGRTLNKLVIIESS